MDRPVTGAALPDWARPLATQIARQMDILDLRFDKPGLTPRAAEDAVFAEFEVFLTLALRKYDPKPARTGERERR